MTTETATAEVGAPTKAAPSGVVYEFWVVMLLGLAYGLRLLRPADDVVPVALRHSGVPPEQHRGRGPGLGPVAHLGDRRLCVRPLVGPEGREEAVPVGGDAGVLRLLGAVGPGRRFLVALGLAHAD